MPNIKYFGYKVSIQFNNTTLVVEKKTIIEQEPQVNTLFMIQIIS